MLSYAVRSRLEESSSFLKKRTKKLLILIPTGDEADRSAARKDFFSEEKKQKTFIHLVRALRQREPIMIKSFLVLFFKKELFLFTPTSSRHPQ